MKKRPKKKPQKKLVDIGANSIEKEIHRFNAKVRAELRMRGMPHTPTPGAN